MWQEITDLATRREDVVVRDKKLFEARNVPNAEDDLDKMKQWVRSIKCSIRRRVNREMREIQNIGRNFYRKTLG